MLPKGLKPIHKYNLIRLGKENDGGYLIEKESQPQIPHELDQSSDPRFDEVKLFFDQD